MHRLERLESDFWVEVYYAWRVCQAKLDQAWYEYQKNMKEIFNVNVDVFQPQQDPQLMLYR